MSSPASRAPAAIGRGRPVKISGMEVSFRHTAGVADRTRECHDFMGRRYGAALISEHTHRSQPATAAACSEAILPPLSLSARPTPTPGGDRAIPIHQQPKDRDVSAEGPPSIRCNRSGEALFGYDGSQLVQRNEIFHQLFERERQPAGFLISGGHKGANVAEACSIWQRRNGPACARTAGSSRLSMDHGGRTRTDAEISSRCFRDLSRSRTSDSEPKQSARRPADRRGEKRPRPIAGARYAPRSAPRSTKSSDFSRWGDDRRERFGALKERLHQ